MDDLEEELTSSWVEDEDGSIDRLGGEVTFEGLQGENDRSVCKIMNSFESRVKYQYHLSTIYLTCLHMYMYQWAHTYM